MVNKEKVFVLLDTLSELGSTKMYRAVFFILDEFFELSAENASNLLSEWTSTFNERHKK